MKNIKSFFTFFFLIFSACEIEEIPREPLLATPLGLEVKTAPAPNAPDGSPRTGLVVFFTANNPEIYFSGFSIYVSTREEDFRFFASETESFFPLNPLQVPGTHARLLTNYAPVIDTNVSIWIGGKMAFPERRFYPPDALLSSDPNIPESNPEFSLTSFSELPPGGPGVDGMPFTPGTRYYFGVYAYSSIDAEFSLPSNIVSIVFPNHPTPPPPPTPTP